MNDVMPFDLFSEVIDDLQKQLEQVMKGYQFKNILDLYHSIAVECDE